MTVAELRKKLRGLDGNLPVWTADHDHAEYETNGLIDHVEVYEQDGSENLDQAHIREGKYVVLHT